MALLDLPVHRGTRALEPRLRSLLRLDPAQLFEFHKTGWSRLTAAIAQVDDIRKQVTTAAAPDATLLAALRTARSGLIVPYTFGVYYPSNDATAGHVAAIIWSDASADDLTAAGITIRSRAGNVFTANIPLRVLWAFADENSPTARELGAAFKYVEMAKPWRLRLIDAIPRAHLDTLHTKSVTGDQVVVGIVDTGIDVAHEHFRDAAGGSRIEFLWDQALTARLGTPFGDEQGPLDFPLPGGVEYDKSWIDAELAGTSAAGAIMQSVDINGHGTTVASCAASSGHLDGSGNKVYVGAAPDARLVVVKLSGADRVFADSATVLDGIAYAYSRADMLGLPCVVNLSLSDSMGAHDGTALAERHIDNLLLTPGRAFVCSAGNQNQAAAYIRGVVPAAGLPLQLTYGPLPPRFTDSIQIWYDGHDRLALQIDIPMAPAVTVGPVAPGSSTLPVVLTGTISIQVISELADPRNGDNVIHVIIANPNGEVLPIGNWQFTLTPAAPLISGAFDAWADDQENDFLFRQWAGAYLGSGTIGVPSTSFRGITVGAHVANDRTQIDMDSGCGPTRDGRVKPEVCASNHVLAAASKDASPPGTILRAMHGTSASAPIVAGTVACLFQCRGASLPSSDVKQLLLDAAEGKPKLASENEFGFGTLDADTLCDRAASTVDVWIRDSNFDAGVEPYTGPEPPFSSPDIELLDAVGNPIANPQYHPMNLWNNRIDVTVRNRGSGVARNVDVYLYWTDPATYIPFPLAWYTSGIYTGGPAFLAESNRVVINSIPPGGAATAHFAWAPPSPGSNIRSDAHFCLLARVEHEEDPSNLATGGWGVIAGSNNIAMRNVDVVDVAVPAPPTGLNIVGTGEMDSMEFWSDFWGNWQIIVPTQILPWRELSTLATLPIEARGQINVQDISRDLDERAATRILGVSGARRAQVRGPLTLLHAEGESSRVHVSALRLRENAVALVRVAVNGVRLQRERGFLNIAQRSGGKIVGGVRIEFRNEVPRAPHYIVTHKGDEVIIRRAEGDERPDRDATPRRIPPQWRQPRRRTTV